MSRDLARVLEGLLSGSLAEWVAFVALVLVIAVSAWAVARFRASLRGDADPAAAEADLVRQVRELRDRGDVSEREYRSLKGRVVPPAGGTSRGRAAGAQDRANPPP